MGVYLFVILLFNFGTFLLVANCKCKGAQDPGLRITILVQFCKLSSHWRMNDGSNQAPIGRKNVWF